MFEFYVPSLLWFVDIVIVALIYLLIYLLFRQFIKTKMIVPSLVVLFVAKAVASYFGFVETESVINLATIVMVVSFSVIYSQEIRRKLINGSHKLKGKNKQNNKVDAALMQQINDAVLFLSSNRIGAIITFEKTDNLDHYISSGEAINAPITSALIKTIFYEGTALHDGAIIIRDNMICAASVYFTPSTKPLAGKYGSRHRAALGISEVTDAVTIVVSEETGRISFTENGDMMSASRDSFAKQLEELLTE